MAKLFCGFLHLELCGFSNFSPFGKFCLCYDCFSFLFGLRANYIKMCSSFRLQAADVYGIIKHIVIILTAASWILLEKIFCLAQKLKLFLKKNYGIKFYNKNNILNPDFLSLNIKDFFYKCY